jgi:exosortase/archaeosortase family protein
MTIGFLMAYFYKGALWKRSCCSCRAFPITVLMNSIRVGTIGVMVEHWGIGMAEGFLHEFQGWMVFMVSTALMLGEIALLNRIGRERGTWRQLFGVEFPARPAHGQAVSRPAAKITGELRRRKRIAAGRLRAVDDRHSAARGDLSGTRLVHAISNGAGALARPQDALEQVYTDQLKLDDYLLADYADRRGRQRRQPLHRLLQLAAQG